MAINFPDSPVNGDTHVVGNVTYVYNNAKNKWVGAGQTPNDRLTEGSGLLEIESNNLAYTGGNFSIGTTTANNTLTLYGDASSSLRISKSGVLAYDHTFDGSTYTIANNNGSAGIPLIFGTLQSGAESVRITESGVLKVGSSSTINVQISPNTGLEINDGAINCYQATTNVNATPFQIRSDVGGTGVQKLSIKGDGDIIIGGTDVAASLPGIKMYLGGADPSLVGCKADNNPGQFVTLLKLAGYSQSGANFRENAAIVFETDTANNVGSASGRILLRTENENSTNGPSTRVQIDDEGIFFNYSENHGIYTETSVGAGTVKYLYRGANTNGSNIVFNVWSNGNVESATNSFGPVSDVRLKENIVDAESQWEDVKAIQFRKFNFKEETGYQTHTQLGVIAQELEEISPGLVYETPDIDRDGNDLGTTTKKVKASVLTMKAMVALQEAMARIEELEARLEAAGI